MKIGIITYHLAANFGANLQVLSTVGYLRNNNHTPIVINWQSPEIKSFYTSKTPQEQLQVHDEFRKSYLPLSKVCYTDEDIANVIKEENIEGIIIGSDAVLQHHPLLSRIVFPTKKIIHIRQFTSDRMFPNFFWGTFTSKLNKKIPLVFMSASSQDSDFHLFSNKLKKQMFNALSKYNYISVRDEWTQKMILNITSKQTIPPITPDPVFAFNQNISSEQLSKEYILNKFNLPEKYILLSFLSSKNITQKWLNEFEVLAQEKDIECVALPFPGGLLFENNLKYKIKLPLSPLEWYALIKYSAGYVGHNMHPIVVSLHNTVPFFSFDNYGTVSLRIFVKENTSKIYHILKEANFPDYRVSNIGVNSKLPSAEYIFNKLYNFNKENALKFSQRYYDEYQNMMNQIIHTFNKS